MRFIKFSLICYASILAGSTKAAEIKHETYRGKDTALEIIAIEGAIESGDVERFRQISLKYPKAVVILNSNGGMLFPAIEIGKIIKIVGNVTVVPKDAVCASSCALIWVAGSTRYLSPEGRVGFHASYRSNEGKLEESGVANALVGNYLTLLNLPQKAIIFATMASPDKISWLTKANKGSVGIDFEDFGLSGDARPAVPPPVILPPAVIIPPTVPNGATRKFDIPPSHSVTILSEKPLGKDSYSYKFSYLGLTLERWSEGKSSESDLADLIDSQVKDSPWLYYGLSGGDKTGDMVFYHIDIKSIKRWNGIVSAWIKEDHEYDKTVKYREAKVFYNINCKDQKIQAESEYRYDSSGKNVYYKTFDYYPERIVPETMDSVLWETVCSN